MSLEALLNSKVPKMTADTVISKPPKVGSGVAGPFVPTTAATPMGFFGRDINTFMGQTGKSDAIKNWQDQQTQQNSLADTYNGAYTDTEAQHVQDATDYDALAQLQQRKLVGNINQGGMGFSMLNKGYGTGAGQELAYNQGQAKGNLNSEYANLENALTTGFNNNQGDLSQFWTDFSNTQSNIAKQKQAQSAGPLNYLGTAAGLIGLL
jgi:hypothetical protein